MPTVFDSNQHASFALTDDDSDHGPARRVPGRIDQEVVDDPLDFWCVDLRECPSRLHLDRM